MAQEDVYDVCRTMHTMYQRPKATYISVSRQLHSARAAGQGADPAPQASPLLANGCTPASGGVRAETVASVDRAEPNGPLGGSAERSTTGTRQPEVWLEACSK